MNMRTFSQRDLALRMTYPGFVFRALSKEGHDLKRLLANTGLTEEVLSDPEFQTGLPPLRRFFLNAIEQTGEPHLGIRLAQQFEANFIGLPAYASMNASTFKDALAVLSRFFFLAFPAIEFTSPDKNAEVQPGEFAIRLRPKLPLGDISYFASVSALVACEGLCKAILRTPKAALRGEMSISQPEGWAHVEEQIGFPIRFQAPDIRLFLADVLLTRALPGADPLNHPRLLALCEQVAERARVETTPFSEVTSFLQEGQNLALPISQVAAALGYSERSLRRHLERSGTTFRKLTSEIREQRARGMLANTAIPIKTIAHDLGFDTPSNFARSFKRWAGTSPSAFRLARSAKDISGQN
ncbi:AraC family transcriptional regulator [Gloeobacter morelensis]|uniref:AraC family transcriptional regulator ligand-binding domain-containing protein n=1 Tax=Gloeobacter morelensis MG652769 TaxID=2781736 RepID=A0ABY3PNI9_9CYAN|nr:AraC family transcriptional regulator [Gloeobacter morelensis]UFP95179.1 AraC family transcriptional regulator ligand-binding domain-containing protein [Gloeobacter morelensis MG652769]